ncbi:hypothetical protein EHS13_29710 [Paenibacillus psychroresistens]|uniref:Uncharacterized protein n=1 Tax=Paenibacillus psychroresistens TaxID=1778678 RepID=A0A6B8RS85_9BACL|nr:hypothetical protein [Paenibacillus psychroresistens]QGQ98757.1 hypothetical protein EHS13_29710 [Paenibacillus psychroresistens]
MDNPKNESDEIPKEATEADPSATETETDQDWKQFIHAEQEKFQNREKMEQNPIIKEGESSAEILASILVKIPVKRIVESAVEFLNKKVSKSKKKSKK